MKKDIFKSCSARVSANRGYQRFSVITTPRIFVRFSNDSSPD